MINIRKDRQETASAIGLDGATLGFAIKKRQNDSLINKILCGITEDSFVDYVPRKYSVRALLK